jgi:hypothetical protein
MSQTSARRIHDMTSKEIEDELGIRAPNINRAHLAKLLAERREESASHLREGSLPISNIDEMTSQQIMHELFYVYGHYAPDLNREHLVKLLAEYREGLIPAIRFLDPSAMTNHDLENEMLIHIKLNRYGLHRITADFIRTLRNISQQAYAQQTMNKN